MQVLSFHTHTVGYQTWIVVIVRLYLAPFEGRCKLAQHCAQMAVVIMARRRQH